MRRANHLRMRYLRAAAPWIALSLGLCAAPARGAASDAASLARHPILDGSEGPRTLLVIDPVDLSFDAPKRAVGDFLRARGAESGRWTVLPADSARKHLKEYKLDPDQPCKDFQCAFDAGSALGTEFVLFGTVAPLGELQAYTLNLLHVPTTQVVWSRAGEVQRREDEYPLAAQKRALEWAVSDLDVSRLDLRKQPGRGSLALIDNDLGSVQSKAVYERAVAHLYAARRFDLVNRNEMADLFKAMDISPPDPSAPEDSLTELGRKLEVRYVLCSRLDNVKREYRLRVSLHDLDNHGAARVWPKRETADFGKLLRVEDRIFSDLRDPSLPDPVPAVSHSGLKTASRVLSITLALGAATGLGYLALENKREADQEYQRFRASRSQQEAEAAREKVQYKDAQAGRYGLAGGAGLLLGAAIWAF